MKYLRRKIPNEVKYLLLQSICFFCVTTLLSCNRLKEHNYIEVEDKIKSSPKSTEMCLGRIVNKEGLDISPIIKNRLDRYGVYAVHCNEIKTEQKRPIVEGVVDTWSVSREGPGGLAWPILFPSFGGLAISGTILSTTVSDDWIFKSFSYGGFGICAIAAILYGITYSPPKERRYVRARFRIEYNNRGKKVVVLEDEYDQPLDVPNWERGLEFLDGIVLGLIKEIRSES